MEFAAPKFGTVYREKQLEVNARTRDLLKNGARWLHTLYYDHYSYDFLKPRDVIEVAQTKSADGGKVLIKVTHKRKELATDLLAKRKDDPMAASVVEEQIGRKLDPTDVITILEFKVVYDWQLDRK